MKKRLAVIAAALTAVLGVAPATGAAAVTDRLHLQDGTGTGPTLDQTRDGTGAGNTATQLGGSHGVPEWAAFHGSK